MNSQPDQGFAHLKSQFELNPAMTDADHEDLIWLRDEYALTGAVGSRAPDWQGIETKAANILPKINDLNVISYLVSAWVVRHKIEGLITSLELMALFLDKNWDHIKQPVKFRTRILGGLESFLNKHLPNCESNDALQLERGVEAAVALKGTILDRFEDPPSDFARIRNHLKQLRDLAPKTEPEAASTTVQPDDAVLNTEVQKLSAPDAAAPGPPPSAQSPAATSAQPIKAAEPPDDGPTIAKPIEGVLTQALIDQILGPISTDAPAGKNPKQHDDWEDISDEAGKSGAIGAGGPDWTLIETKSIELLSQTGKSMFLISFLGGAWIERYKFSGIVAAAEITHDFIEIYWDKLFLPVRARGNALVWLHKRLAKRLDSSRSEDRELLQRAKRAFNKLKSQIPEKFENPPCDFLAMRNKVRDWIDQLPAEKPPEPEPEPVKAAEPQAASPPPTPETVEAPPPEPAAAPVPTPTPTATSSTPITSNLDLNEADVDAVYAELARFATHLQGIDPTNPLAALIIRRVIWNGAKQPPDKNRITMIPPPPKQIRNSLETMKRNAAWDRIFANAEDYAQKFRYWLDLQFLSAEAAVNMEQTQLAEVIEAETLALVEQVPKLTELQFKDGLPFASEDTLTWLAKAKQKATAGSGETTENPVETLRGILSKAGAEGFSDAMSEAQQMVHSAGDALQRFEFRLTIGKYCLTNDQHHLAEGLAENLVAEAEDQRLGYWQPELAAAAWTLLIEVCRKGNHKDKHYLEREREAMRHLMGLDVKRAAGFPKRPNLR